MYEIDPYTQYKEDEALSWYCERCGKHVGTRYDDGLCQDCAFKAQKEDDNG